MAIRTSVAVDAGSFEPEMGVYETSYKTGTRRADHIRYVIVLGKDTYSEGKISYGLVEETRQVLGRFVQIMKTHRVKDYRAYATGAMKEACDDQAILEQTRVRTGLNVCTISNSEQRFTGCKAIAAMVGEFNKVIQKGTAVADIGFGSAQPPLFDKDTLVAARNLPLGTLHVQSLLARIPAIVSEHREQIEEIVDNELFTFRKMYLRDREVNDLIGVGEDILYVINRMDLKVYGDRADAIAMNRSHDRLCQLTADQIEEKFDVNNEYASLLPPSMVAYKRILELAEAEIFWVPGIHLYDGIAAEYIQDDKLVRFSHNFGNDILAALRNMAKRYKRHASHSRALEQYVLGISDSMKKYRGLDSRKCLLLQIAALLHAYGKFISTRNSNECSYSIIMSTEIIGLSYLEREIIASVIRYSTRDFNYNKIQLETQLLQENVSGYSHSSITILIAKLTAILRLANSMGRSHRIKPADCRMAVRDNELVITTGHAGDMVLETSSFDQKADFFEETFGVGLVLKQKRRV